MRSHLRLLLLVTVAALAATVAPATAADPGLLLSWGSSGRAPGQFGHLNDLATDAAGDVYVLDRENVRVQRFASDGSLLGVWGTLGNDPGQLRAPWDLSVTASGEVYVMEGSGPRIQVHDRDGALLRWWQLGNTGPIAVDAAGTRVYMASGSQVWAMDQTGAPIAQWGTFGAGPGQLQNVADLVVGPDGDLYVLDDMNRRVVVFAPDGRFVREFGGLRDAMNSRPTAIAVRASGEVLVMSSQQESAIQRFTATGASAGPDIVRCAMPTAGSGLAAGPGDVIYGAFGMRVDKFGPGGAASWVATCHEWLNPPGPPGPPGGPPTGPPPSRPPPVSEPDAPAPPPGRPGVSVDAGAQYTNAAAVTLKVVWPRGARTVLVSNDGGFERAREFPVAASIPWRLDSSGPERLPKTVYVRFGASSQTFTDDIILDETAPRIESVTLVAAEGRGTAAAAAARAPLHRLRLRASDRTSGVAKVQLAISKARPLPSQRYRRTLSVRGRAAPRFVRVQDRAGNVSRWRAIAQRPASRAR